MTMPRNANLFSRLFDGLDDTGRTAIETPAGTRLTYGDLIAISGRMANYLVKHGVKPGDRVAAQTEKSIEALALYLATVRAGAVYLPLNSNIADRSIMCRQAHYIPVNQSQDGVVRATDTRGQLGDGF